MQDLQRRQLDAQLGANARLRETKPPSNGWLSAIRHALGMQTRQFAARLRISHQAASEIERSERQGSITLASLRKAADALDCDVVFALVPRQSLAHTYSRQLLAKASAISESVTATMALEAQSDGVDDVMQVGNANLEALRRKLGPRLWD